MDRPRLIHRLRIAATMFFAVVAVALCLLWVRSYSTLDIYQRVRPNRDTLTITSLRGEVVASSRPWPSNFLIFTRFDSGPITDDVIKFWYDSQGISRVHFHTQYWKLVAIMIACLAAVWWNFRFSLRTLLIAITLVSVVLGLIVWTNR